MRVSIPTRLPWLFLIAFFVPACVTVIVNFPAEEIEESAEDIIDEVRPEDVEAIPPSDDDEKDGARERQQSALLKLRRQSARPVAAGFVGWRLPTLLLGAPEPTKESDKVKNDPVVRSIRKQLGKRFPRLLYFYNKSVVGENQEGFVEALPAELSLKEKKVLAKLIAAENKDRKNLYKQVARIEKVDPSQIGKIQKIYARRWIKKARKGWWVQNEKKKWVRKT